MKATTFIIFFILINVLFGLGATLGDIGRVQDTTTLNIETDIDGFTSQTNINGNSFVDYSTTGIDYSENLQVFEDKEGISLFWELLGNGLNPTSIQPDDFESDDKLGRIIARIIMVMRIFILLVAGYMMYQLLRGNNL